MRKALAGQKRRGRENGLEWYDDFLKLKGRKMGGATGNLRNHEGRIIRDPGICGGEPVFKGTRVMLRTVLASLADGDATEEILADFPSLKADDVQAAASLLGRGKRH